MKKIILLLCLFTFSSALYASSSKREGSAGLKTSPIRSSVHTLKPWDGFPHGVGHVTGIDFGLLSTQVTRVDGVQFSLGIANGGEVNGVELGLVGALAHKTSGLSLAAGGSKGLVKGVSFSLFNATRANGFSMGLVREDGGCGVSVGAYHTRINFTGLQIGLWNNNKYLKGLQVGLRNYAEEAVGVQLGLFNKAGALRGVQLGLINTLVFAAQPRVLPLLNIRL